MIDSDANSENRATNLSNVFTPGETVWKVTRSQHAAFLIDANAFYTALVEACFTAEREIFIVGWDTDSRTELPIPSDCPAEYLSPAGHLELGNFLAALTRERPELNVYILTWDFAFIYMLERESLPSLRFTSLESDRLRFVLDRHHPVLASHHQKIVVIDRKIAFSGGLDITQRRWDTPEHKGDDPRRTDPDGKKYGPFHDVQFCVDGETAQALGEIARERWLLATGAEVPLLSCTLKNQWPPSAAVAMRNVDVAISRTIPQDLNLDSSVAIGEVEALFIASLKRVRQFAYIENQYFTSSLIAKALAERLAEADGPEIVMVLPRDETGWIEESTMGLLRAEALKTVRSADRHHRFRCYYPVVPGLGSGYVKIHSKVMVLDDEFMRIGSANLNGRSMGVDTECDLSVAAEGREDVRRAIRNLRESLIAEHLGVLPSAIAARFHECGSLVATVESFRGQSRTLVELEAHVPEWVEKMAPPADWIDPTAPRGIRRWWLAQFATHRFLFVIFFGLLSGAAWVILGNLHPVESFEILTNWWHSFDPAKVSLTIEELRGAWWSVPVILASFVAATFVWIPITALIMGLAISFPPAEAFFLSIGGALAAALVGYGIGRYWAFTKSRILSRPWVQKASRQLQHGSLWKVVVVRLLPVAPFMVVNVVAGGLRVSLRDFTLGSFLGLLPGIILITILSRTAAEFLQSGKTEHWQVGGGVVLAIVLLYFLLPSLWRKLHREHRQKGPDHA